MKHQPVSKLSTLEYRLKRATKPKDKLAALMNLGAVLLSNDVSKAERSLVIHQEASALAEQLGDKRKLAQSLRARGAGHLHLMQFDMALPLFERVLKLAEETGDAECEVTVLRDLGSLNARQDKSALAIEYLERCIPLAKLIDSKAMESSALNILGMTFKNLGRYQEALACQRRSLAVITELGTHNGMIITRLHISNTLRLLGDYPAALTALEECEALCIQFQDRPNQALALLGMGLLHTELGNYEQSLDRLFGAVRILEQVGDVQNLANAYGNINQVYSHLNDLPQAAEWGERARLIFEKLGDKRGLSGMLSTLAQHQVELRNYPVARRMLKQSLSLAQALGSKDYETTALLGLARVNTLTGKHTTAELNFRNALTMVRATGDKDKTCQTLIQYGALLNTLQRYDEALTFLREAIVLSKQLKSNRHLQDAHREASVAFEHNGSKDDLRNALHHLKESAKINEEILGVEKQRGVTDRQVRFQMERFERERTQVQNELNSLKTENARLSLIIAEKNERLLSIKNKISALNPTNKNAWSVKSQQVLEKLRLELRSDTTSSSEQDFAVSHLQDMQQLVKRYPQLTPTELKVCMYLRLQHSTKEIAKILKVSDRAVEKHRYRIRQKVRLATNTSLLSALLSR